MMSSSRLSLLSVPFLTHEAKQDAVILSLRSAQHDNNPSSLLFRQSHPTLD